MNSEIQTPAQLASYRARPIQKISFEAALIERDYMRYQEQQNKIRYTIKNILVYTVIFIIALVNAVLVGTYFRNILNEKPINCIYYSYSTKYNFLPKCQLCQESFTLVQGECYTK